MMSTALASVVRGYVYTSNVPETAHARYSYYIYHSALAQLERVCTCIIIRIRIYIRELAHARPPMSSISLVASVVLVCRCYRGVRLIHGVRSSKRVPIILRTSRDLRTRVYYSNFPAAQRKICLCGSLYQIWKNISRAWKRTAVVNFTQCKCVWRLQSIISRSATCSWNDHIRTYVYSIANRTHGLYCTPPHNVAVLRHKELPLPD